MVQKGPFVRLGDRLLPVRDREVTMRPEMITQIIGSRKVT